MRKYKSDIGDLKVIIRKSKAIARNRFSKGDKMTEMTAMISAHDQKKTQKMTTPTLRAMPILVTSFLRLAQKKIIFLLKIKEVKRGGQLLSLNILLLPLYQKQQAWVPP